jgi:hypothetical protein
MKKPVNASKPTSGSKGKALPIAKKAGKALAKKAFPAYAAANTAVALKSKRYGQALEEAAWLTVPTGVGYEAAKGMKTAYAEMKKHSKPYTQSPRRK